MPIKTVLDGSRVPIKIWTDVIEDSAAQPLRNTGNLPFVFKHIAAMPDVHLGVGATVGSVIATKGAVCPAAVGVDIGCGMIAVKTILPKALILDHLPKLRAEIERSIPLGHNSNSKLSAEVESWSGWADAPENAGESLIKKAMHQLGTLGGGNHFIEICLDSDNAVWVMLHSGSRNVGKTLAEVHISKAKDTMKKMFIDLPDPDLAYFAQSTPEFKSYVEDVEWCQAYAFENRKEMMRRVLRQMAFIFNGGEPLQTVMEVNCHHNYLSRESHYGENVIVTRKGAVRAREGDLGIIPGSMGTASFIVRGLGNPESFNSCSHGAGRRMSRSAARKTFTKKDLEDQTLGVECRKDEGVIDEIPGAYKNINEVMQNQSDLVEIVASLKQVLCVKG